MKIRGKTALLVVTLISLTNASCGGNDGSDKSGAADVHNSDLYWPPSASKQWTTQSQRGWWLWKSEPLSEVDKRDADDLTRFHESAFSSWQRTLQNGYVPKTYLSRPRVVFEDLTKGTIPGMEKIKPVMDSVAQKCGAFSPSRKHGIPLRVLWTDTSGIKASLLGDVRGAFRTGAKTGMDAFHGSEESGTPVDVLPKKPSLTVQTTMTPENLIYVWGGKSEEERQADGDDSAFVQYGFDPRTKTWKQTWRDYFGTDPGGKPNTDQPNKVWVGWDKAFNFGGDDPTVDLVFAHELGHAFLVEWALSNGRTAIWTRTFDEMFAEMFSDLCYNDKYPFYPNTSIEDEKIVFKKWEPVSAGRFDEPIRISSPLTKEPNESRRAFRKSDCGSSVNCTSLAAFVREYPYTKMTDDVITSPEGIGASNLNPNNYYAPFNEQIQLTLAAEGRWNEEERRKIFSAVLKTLDAMQGVRLGECAPRTMAGKITWTDPMGPVSIEAPRRHPYAGECAWGINVGDRVLPLEERPLAFTAREFWSIFPRFYTLPERHRETAQGIADALDIVWEY